jgi:hypothetical protein
MIYLACIGVVLLLAAAAYLGWNMIGDRRADEGESEAERCPVLLECPVNTRDMVGRLLYESRRLFRCTEDHGHFGPHRYEWEGEERWFVSGPIRPETVFAIYSEGLLVSATARPHQAEAMARLGHEVRRVKFDRESAELVELSKGEGE